MTEEIKVREKVKGKLIKVVAVEVRTNQYDAEKVDKIVFTTTSGDISYKPKITCERFEDGLKILSVEPSKVNGIAKNIKAIGCEISANGGAIVKATYMVWSTKDKEGLPVKYSYVQGKVQMDEWEIVKTKPDVVEVEEVKGSEDEIAKVLS